jgi:hypothetical protein
MAHRGNIPASQRRQAIEIYQSFREKKPRRCAVVDVDIPSIVASIGHVEAIDYRTTHGRRLKLYRHEFVSGSRPLLCVSPDGRQLYLLGGRFKFTGRGIVDRDANDEEIENEAHGEELDDE